MTKFARLCVPMDCKRGDARGSQPLLLVGDGRSKLWFCCPETPHLTCSVRCTMEPFLGMF